MQIIAILLALLLLPSCLPKEEPAETESTSAASSISSISSSSSLAPAPASSPASSQLPITLAAIEDYLADFTAFWQEFLPDFRLDQMTQRQILPIARDTGEPLALHEDILDRQNELDFPILFPSPSGERVLYVPPVGEEPDSTVALITPGENLYETLQLCGSPCGFDGAVWLDEERFAVTGFTEYYPEGEERCTADTKCTVVPWILFYDLSENNITEYIGPEVDEKIFFSLPR